MSAGVRERALTRVLVHHPGSNHLAYQLVAALQRGGYDARFETGFFHTEDGRAARLARALPHALAERVLRELKRRSHDGVDPARLHLYPWPELAYVALARAGIGGTLLARAVGWRNDAFDRHVARKVAREAPRVVIGHDGSALYAQRAARANGGLALLNQVVGHIEAALDIFREEARLAPEFAQTLPLIPQAIVRRHREEIATAERILVPSDYVRDTLVERGADATRIFVLPYGVDIKRFRPGPAGGTKRPFRLLFVGQLSQRKGIKYLLEAVRRLDNPEIELVLVGQMAGREAAFAPYRKWFRHVPHVPFHEVHALYQDADLFVYPSLHEGSAFAAYEALASGLPVICTPNTGSVVRDGEDGFLVRPRDADALAERISFLYRHPDLRLALATRARARAEEFTWERYGERLCACLDSWLVA